MKLLVHGLKGSSLTDSSSAIAKLATTMEQLVKLDEEEDFADCLSQLTELYEATQQYLKNYLDSL